MNYLIASIINIHQLDISRAKLTEALEPRFPHAIPVRLNRPRIHQLSFQSFSLHSPTGPPRSSSRWLFHRVTLCQTKMEAKNHHNL